MRTKVAFLLALFLLVHDHVLGQKKATFPKYTPENIAEIRSEYARQSRYEEVIDMFRRWEKDRGTPVTHEDSAAWYALQGAIAYTFFDLRELDSAEAVLVPVLDVSVTDFPAQFLQINNAWGVRLVYGGRFADARRHYERLRDLFESKQLTATPLQYCNMIHNLGVSNSHLGDIDAALEVFNHVDDVMQENSIDDNRLKSNLHLNMAGAYAGIRKYKESIEHSGIAHEASIAEYGYYHPFSAQTLNSVANGLVLVGDLEGALNKYKEVLDIYAKIGRVEHPLRTISLLNAAETLDKLGRPAEAIEYIESCIAIRRNAYGIRHAEVARAYKAKGRILGHLGKWDEAVACLDTSLLALGYDASSENPYSGVDAMFNLFYTLDHKADLYYDLSRLQPDVKHLEAAQEAYVLGIQVLNDLRVHFKGKIAKGNLNAKSYMFYEPAIDVCLKLYEQKGDASALEQAFLWSGESKGNDFYDLIRGENAMVTANIPDSIRDRDGQYQQELARLESAWYDAKQKDEQNLNSSRQSLDDAKRGYRAWLKSIELRYPKYYELLHSGSAYDITERRTELRKSATQLVEYFVGDSNVFAFILTPDSMQYVRLDHPDKIAPVVQRWRQDPVSVTEADRSQLSALVWHPLAAHLVKMGRLIIVPDGFLCQVPFEVLTARDGTRVVDNYAVSYDYTSRDIAWKSSLKRNDKWLGMAPEYDFDGGSMAMASRGLDSAVTTLRDAAWIKLPGAEAEVSAIHHLTGGEYRIGESATEGFFRRSAGGYGILHLSMHAWTDDDEPLLSTLIFSDDDRDTTFDGQLYAHEIFQLNLPARLVVLSACNTGIGTFRRGEGISSLARAFIYAGTEATVMSLWKVPDKSTAQIMEAFYKHLRNGERKDDALRNAKLDYLSGVTEPELRRPYHWAGFVLMGDASPVYKRVLPISLAGIAAGIFLLGALFVWMRWRRKSNAGVSSISSG